MKKIMIFLLLFMNFQPILSMHNNRNNEVHFTLKDFRNLLGRFSLAFAAFYGLAPLMNSNERVTVEDILPTSSVLAVSGLILLADNYLNPEPRRFRLPNPAHNF